PETHALTGAESDQLIDYVANTPDASLYLEGGDVWYLNASPELLNWFGIAPLDDGATDLSTVVGSGGGDCDLSSFVILYEGDHASIDRLTQTTPTATTVLENVGPDYGTAIFQTGSTYRTLGVSHEFGGLDPAPHSRRELISAYLLCFLGDPATHTMRAGSASGGPGEEVEQTVVAATHLSVVGYQFGMTFDPTLAQVVEVTVAGTDAESAEFSGADLDNVSGHWTIGVVIDLMPPLEGLSPGYDFTIARARYEIAPTAPIGTVSPLSIPNSVGEPPIQALFTWGAGQTTAAARVPGVLRVSEPAMAVIADDGEADPGETVDHFVRGSYQDALSGYAIGLSFDPTIVQATGISLDDTVAFGAPFFAPLIDNSAGWLTAQVLSDVTTPIDTVFPPAVRGALLKTNLSFDSDASPGTTTTLTIPGAVGNPLIATHFVDAGGFTHLPVRNHGQWTLSGVPLFIRGDANGSGDLPNIADAITILGYLFIGQALLCLDAADVNDDGNVDVGDTIFVLNYQFIAGPAPSAPFPHAGIDPTPDPLDCTVGI
ncbi:MAG: dockerin type I repeat-containing protein, partial [Planctomycetota bacterium]